MHTDEDSLYSIIRAEYRNIIRFLFSHRYEELPSHIVYAQFLAKTNSLEFLIRAGQLIEEDGFIYLNDDLVKWLESSFGISEGLNVSGIDERAKDTYTFYLNYENLTSEASRSKITRQIWRSLKELAHMVRGTQSDIQRLVDREITYENDPLIKLDRLELYAGKTEDFERNIRRCQRLLEDTEIMKASLEPTLRSPRSRLSKQLSRSYSAAAEMSGIIIEYIHRAKENQAFYSKMNEIMDLIQSKELLARTNIEALVADGQMGVLWKAEAAHTQLPSHLWEKEHLLLKFQEKARQFNLIESHQDAPSLDHVIPEAEPIYIADPARVFKRFQSSNKDLLEFLIDTAPAKISKPQEKTDYLLETFCLVVGSQYGEQLYYENINRRIAIDGCSYSYATAFSKDGTGRKRGTIPTVILKPLAQ